jgi:hypothetical protein
MARTPKVALVTQKTAHLINALPEDQVSDYHVSPYGLGKAPPELSYLYSCHLPSILKARARNHGLK